MRDPAKYVFWKKPKLKGKSANATESSGLLKFNREPPVASIKLYPPIARLELPGGLVTVKEGPVAVFPNRVTLTGPLAAPKGTTVLIDVAAALVIGAGVSPNRTSIFWARVSK